MPLAIITPVALYAMYFCSPFFFHPLKLLTQALVGSDYVRAYRHFRSNHKDDLNIVIHLLGLVHIMLANFALLHGIDAAIGLE